MPKKKRSLTPMMVQYLEIRRGLPPNTLLLFRLGDFYEIFQEDAEEGAPILGITLTQRNGMPMAGIPYHAVDGYVNKLLAAGKKVAICDQMEAPKPGKIVKRALTRILTPGTTLEDHQIESKRNHFLLALNFDKSNLLAAWLDLTTGEFQIAEEENPDNLMPVFTSIDPREIITPEWGRQEWRRNDQIHPWLERFEQFCDGRPLTEVSDYHFDRSSGVQSVTDALGVLNLEGFGIREEHPALGSAGALVYYATENLCAKPKNLRQIREYRSSGSLLLDPATIRNLEIFQSAQNIRQGSLLDAMDRTVTAAGARLLQNFLSEPTLDLKELQQRQRCVGEFLEAPGYASELQEYLKCIRDLPRVLGRMQNRLNNPREPGSVRDTLKQVPLILRILDQFEGRAIRGLSKRVRDFPKMRELLQRSLEDDLPNQLQEGGYIRDGYDSKLDELRSFNRENKAWISKLEQEEQGRTKIKNLRIRYNHAFGYFFEVSKSNLHLVPDNYIRRQTMTNAERFYTEELKEKEREILHADEKAIEREETLFRDVTAHILAESENLRESANALAEIDLYLGWSKTAREWDYCCPSLDESDRIEIEEGRHPVVEQTMRKERFGLAGTHAFVPNDVELGSDEAQIILITGPNMAGKSTYIRQVALITLMAQIGSWVPARKCQIGLVDRIFSRVGASDELARGNSTFMVEMNETANILNNSTERTLIILDEIGRGTSTYDGLSIAWAVVEHLHGEGPSGPRTLFATHYHELTQLERLLPRVRNCCVAVKEWNDEIIFVRQVVSGSSDRSYGIQVARLAGLPESVIDRAKLILDKLEADDSNHNLLRKRLKKIKAAEEKGEEPGQLELF